MTSVCGKRGADEALPCPLASDHHDHSIKRLKAAIRAAVDAEALGEYLAGTSLPAQGWFLPCSYCRSLTSNTLQTTQPGELVSVCKRCEQKLVTYFKAMREAQMGQTQQPANQQQEQQEQTQKLLQQQQQLQQQQLWYMSSGQTSPSLSVLSFGGSEMDERTTPSQGSSMTFDKSPS